jgi:hypothetical protein
MSSLAHALFSRDAYIKPDDITAPPTRQRVPFVINVNWWKFSTAYEYEFCIDEEHHPEITDTFYDSDTFLPNPIRGKLMMSRIATNNKERHVTNTFRLTQTSSSAALFEFLTTDDGVIRNPPVCLLAVKHQPNGHTPVWIISGKKHQVFQTLFPNTEESGFGISSWLADNVDILIAPSAANERLCTLVFVLKLLDIYECTRSEAMNHSYVRKIAQVKQKETRIQLDLSDFFSYSKSINDLPPSATAAASVCHHNNDNGHVPTAHAAATAAASPEASASIDNTSSK